jgi:hypothetical protein
LVELLWTSDQPVAKACTYTGQRRKRRKIIHAFSGIQTHDLSVQAINAYTSDLAATETGFQQSY